ncbi:MAG: preprotein translocase subunit Sec61beta [Euryarchaeota archaeon]|nr:preprotein translocase subunit Sec61beta [Euryarchaeota archaeon]
MAKKEKNTGFQASAGLIRYFDAEEKSAFRIHPNVVIGVSLLTAVAIYALKIFYPV